MHPEILRELHAQHRHDLQQQAHRALLARTVRRTRQALRRNGRQGEADEFAVPAIPDYVDGSFRAAGSDAAGSGPGNEHTQVPAARHAA
jgi:hypothetical protein